MHKIVYLCTQCTRCVVVYFHITTKCGIYARFWPIYLLLLVFLFLNIVYFIVFCITFREVIFMKIKWKDLIVCLIIPLAVGGLSAFLTRNSMDIYSSINQPPLAPPSILFPIVWTILFILMGVSSYLVYTSDATNKREALTLYGVQLVVNFIWPLLFFNMQAYLFSFIWLVLLWVLVALMIRQFYKATPIASYLQIPYILWLTFAAYLNFAIFLMN